MCGVISDAPEWIRLPKPKARCAVTSLSRTALSELCRTVDETGAPAVKTLRLKKSGAKRETLLINRESLLRFLDAKASDQALGRGLHLAPEAQFARFSEREIAEDRDLWTWAVNPSFFPDVSDWVIGKLSNIDTRLSMMRQAGLTWAAAGAGTNKADASTKSQPIRSKRFARVIRDWSTLSDLQRLKYWGPVCKDISKRAAAGEDLSHLSPALFLTFLQFICLANYYRGAETPFPKLLDNPRKTVKFASAIRAELDNLTCNPEQRNALNQRIVKAEQYARLKEQPQIAV